MRLREFIEPNSKGKFLDMFEKFLPLAMHYLELKSLPKMKFQSIIQDTDQPTFGKYENGKNELHVALINRHPIDILRTVAHELAHYKQDLENRLKPNSGETGSDEENEAHALAGVVMRHFNKKYPEFLEDKPVVSESITNKINEAQTFDFEGNKQTILKFIDNVLNNRPNNRQYNPFYTLIVGDPKIGGASKLGLPDQFAASWKKYFQNPAFVGGAPEPWSQVNIGDKFTKATGDDRTLNFYITVDKEKDNIINFLKNLHKLANYLKPISDQYQTPIKFKTHSLLDSFIGHNDSLKVYYYEPKVKDLVVDATKKWLSDSGISTGSRSHEHGVDVKSGGGSFGQILSNHVYDTFTKLIQTNGTKYTPEQYFEWLKQHLPSLIQQVKQKEVAENFADGRNPQDKGDSARHGIRKGMTIAQLKKIRSSKTASPRKKQLAHWQINMRQGRKK